MKFVVIDIQGFCIPEFYAKELVFYDGNDMKSYLFKPTKPFYELSEDCQKQALFLYGNRHGLYYNYGETDYSDLCSILWNNLRNVDVVYVKGHIKKEFLIKTFSDMNHKLPYVINLEFTKDSANVPKLNMSYTDCPYHSLEYCTCSVKNANILYDYIYNCLPK